MVYILYVSLYNNYYCLLKIIGFVLEVYFYSLNCNVNYERIINFWLIQWTVWEWLLLSYKLEIINNKLNYLKC